MNHSKTTADLLKEFEARGGEVKRIEPIPVKTSGFSRYKIKDLNPGYGERYHENRKLKRKLAARKRNQDVRSEK